MPRLLIALVAAVPALLLLLPVAAVAVLLCVFAGTVRRLGRALEPPFVPWTQLMVFDPRFGWKPRPNLDTHYLADHDDVFRIVTDGEGWPGRASVEESRVVVIGDSFAFGYGVDTPNSFAEIEPAARIKAIGAPGYSMVHGVLLMEDLGARLRDKLVVWFVYLENDLQDNLAPEMRRYRAPFARRDPSTGSWAIAAAHVRAARWSCSDLDRRRLFPRLCVPGPLADRAYGACDYLIGRAASACSRVGARLAVVTIPHPMQLTAAGRATLASLSGRPAACDAAFPDRQLAACCQRLQVPFVAGMDHLSGADYKHREGIHWNEQGHRRMAGLVRCVAEDLGVAAGGRTLRPAVVELAARVRPLSAS